MGNFSFDQEKHPNPDTPTKLEIFFVKIAVFKRVFEKF
jgi:hypothetical protein